MENKEYVFVSDNTAVQNGTDTLDTDALSTGVLDTGTLGTDILETVMDEAEEAVLEETIVVDGADAAESGKPPKDALLTGTAIAAEVLLIGALVVLRMRRKRKEQKENRDTRKKRNPQNTAIYQDRVSDMAVGQPKQNFPPSTGQIRVGKLHNIGRRSTQQDSLGVMETPEGIFAVVADGMGGLSDGDKVSQTIVMTMLQEISEQRGTGTAGRLFEMVFHVNDAVNRMLGVRSQYVSGSTVVAVLAGEECFDWISVGDSRVCLYRNGRLIQLNREHNYEAELLWQAVNGEITFAEARNDPKRRSLTSFIGMGKLKYIDGSLRPVEVVPGDCLLLMSDGVFNTLSEKEIGTILQTYPDPQQAAEAMEKQILAYNRPKQDNFTAVLLRF